MGYLLRKAVNSEWNQLKRKKCVVVNKAERSWRSEEHSFLVSSYSGRGCYVHYRRIKVIKKMYQTVKPETRNQHLLGYTCSLVQHWHKYPESKPNYL